MLKSSPNLFSLSSYIGQQFDSKIISVLFFRGDLLLDHYSFKTKSNIS
jgi:hypothetical protein